MDRSFLDGSTKGIFELQSQNELQRKEATMWRQRSKQLWLSAGDKNSKYFHSMATVRKKNNGVMKLKKDGDEWAVKHKEKETIVHQYFLSLFTSMANSEVVDTALEGFERRLTEEMQNTLDQPFTAQDVKDAYFKCTQQSPQALTV